MDNVLSGLVEALRCLPGVGPKSAQRMVFHLLQYQRQKGLHLATCLEKAMVHVRACQRCNNFTVENFCNLCSNTNRDISLLCVVENPSDVTAIEQSHAYSGYYYVLMNKISPLDGIGPEDIGLSKLQALIHDEGIKEVILALSPTVEGQTTVHFIQELLAPMAVKVSQLARGIPIGGELEFLDGNTIGNALRNRKELSPE
ncbi:Recombination and repair protein recR (plasmid) [Legionella adelaidensis]|jgi:recombination protein RecR|uniref:Recombination protein RecR n=1 Tax=Legionella adelaidensis TaxID=45056 RepID=A0A0W0R2G9_9GAMM|nr:recombination mediator RecR [Legionella adelaidensis]KTC65286.1 Recombination and repair protein recR [Legionella adelaidensis]VEH81220.1 Recombination and repair protein recR [Legionella adelaidensis]